MFRVVHQTPFNIVSCFVSAFLFFLPDGRTDELSDTMCENIYQQIPSRVGHGGSKRIYRNQMIGQFLNSL